MYSVIIDTSHCSIKIIAIWSTVTASNSLAEY